MSVPGDLFLPACCQPLQPVLADRLQHPIARLAVRTHVRPQEAVCHQGGDEIEDVNAVRRREGRIVQSFRLNVTPSRCLRGDGFGRFQGQATGEDRQAAKERLLGGVEQVVGPGDGVAHRPQPGRDVPWPAGQQRQAAFQAVQQCRRRQRGDTGSG